MVNLTEILEQFPWNNEAPEEWSDKEVYTHTVYPDDSSHVWSVPILPCLDGFAYVGFRINSPTLPNSHPIYPSSVILMTGDGKRKPIITSKFDVQICGSQTATWTPFKIPLPSRLLHLDEDEPLLEITFPNCQYGRVEFLAQKFDELASLKTPLWFCENDSSFTGQILTPYGHFYRLDTLTKRKEFPTAVSITSLVT